MQVINIGGENYYKVDGVYEFINLCNVRKECIFCIEFYRIEGKQVIPYEYLQSIDSTELFNTENNKDVNVRLCNNFVKDCVDKCYDKVKKMYFSAILE